MGISIRAYARHRGVSDAAVRKAIKAGRIVKESDGTIDPVKADAAWERNTNPAQQRQSGANPSANQGTQPKPVQASNPIRPKSPAGNPQGPDYQTSRAIRETYAARMAKLDFEERNGDLLRADEVRVEAFNTARRVRDRLLTIPFRVASVLAAETDERKIEGILNQELRNAMEELSQ